ncbi:MAG: Ig-like domain-containing protein [Patescibacteria group bacterium]|jgi:hypothetical protein
MTYQDTFDRLRSLRFVLGVAVATVGLSLLCVSQTYAAAPTGSSAVMNNSAATTFDVVVTGTDFEHFTSANSVNADATDLLKITYDSVHPTAAVVTNITTITATFAIASGTDKSGGAFTMDVGTVHDSGAIDNLAISIATGSITDSAKPVLLSAVLSKPSTNRITFTYSEPVTVANGASSVSIGDMTTAGTVTGIGSFGTTGSVKNAATAHNTVAGSGTSIVTVDLAAQSGSYLHADSAAEPTGDFTPVADAAVVDLATVPNQVYTTYHPTSSGGETWDHAKPTVSTAVYEDSNNNGTVDRANINFTEDVATGFTADKDEWTLPVAGSITLLVPTLDANVTNATTHVYVAMAADAGETGGGTAPTLSYTRTAGMLRDAAGNIVADFVGQALTDAASPVVLTASPTASATTDYLNTAVIVTFSEEMTAELHYTTDYTVTPTDTVTYWPNTADVWATNNSIANSKVTFTRNRQYACNTAYTITMVSAEVVAATGSPAVLNTSASGVGDGIWTFYTGPCPSETSDTNTIAKTYTMGVSEPNGNEVLAPDDTFTIEWISGGTGSLMNYIDIYYSTDDGATYTQIVSNTENDGTYLWTVPPVESEEVIIKVVGTDLETELANDVSDEVLTITAGETTGENVTVPSTGETGLSPVTGLEEDISVVEAGDYLRGSNLNTVYYIDSDLHRHAFMDSQTYFTWQSSFSSVKVVTDATLTTLTLGSTMLPKAGVVLVKIQSDPKVYMLESNTADALKPTLRWITSEAIAQALYGSAWSNYVIDVPPTMFGWFGMGTDVTSISSTTVDMSIMKLRGSLQ